MLGHTFMHLPMLYPLWSHALPSTLSLPPKKAKFCSLFRGQLKCHVLWEGFPCPSSKENNHPSCWHPQPRTHSPESRRAELVTSPWSPYLYNGGKSPLPKGEGVGRIQYKGTGKAPKHSVGTQSMPSNPWLKFQFQPANPAESRKGVSGTLPIYLFQLFSGGPWVLFLVGYYQPTAHWKINND